MSNKIRFLSLVLTLLICVGLGYVASRVGESSQFSGNFKKISHAYPLSGYSKTGVLNLDVRFIAGELTMYPLNSDLNAIEFNALYKVREVRPLIRVESEKISIQVRPSEKWGFSGRSFWNVGLNPSISHAVTIDAKTSKQILNLSGIPIQSLMCQSGAGKLSLNFDQPNPIEMTYMHIVTKASRCSIVGLMNARVKNCAIIGTAGYYMLDFSGEQTTSCNLILDGSISKATLVFPPHLNAHIVLKDSMVNVTYKHLIKRSKVDFVTADFDPKKPLVTLHVQVGVGSLDIQD